MKNIGAIFPPSDPRVVPGLLDKSTRLIVEIVNIIKLAMSKSPEFATTYAREIKVFNDFLVAEKTYAALCARPNDRAARAAFTVIVPHLAAVQDEINKIVAAVFTAAGQEGYHRDRAGASIICGNAWVAESGAVIEPPKGRG